MRLINYLSDREKLKSDVVSVLRRAWGKTWMALNQFIDKNLFQYSGALAFNTVLAIVPLVALFFAIARGFGYGSIIENTVRQLLSSQPDAANYIIQFANSYLSNARSSAIIGFGVLVMSYSVIGLVNNIETVFNTIWNVKRSRDWGRRIISYLSMFFLVPVTMVLVSGIHLAVSRFIANSTAFNFLTPMLQGVVELIPIVVITLVFLLVFVNMPNTRVRPRHAIVPALLAAIFLELLQRAYVYGQVFLSSYNAIYGSLAALPLFMLWVQFSWYIVLFFALLTHTSQDYEFYRLCEDSENISYNDRVLLSAALLGLICRRFVEGKDHYTATALVRETGVPHRLVGEILGNLCAVKMIAERRDDNSPEPTYSPYEDIDNITVGKMLEKLNNQGSVLDRMSIVKGLNPEVMKHVNRVWTAYITGMKDVKISDLLVAPEGQDSAE